MNDETKKKINLVLSSFIFLCLMIGFKEIDLLIPLTTGVSLVYSYACYRAFNYWGDLK